MKFVCNASPLISLSRAGLLNIVHDLAERVVVPKAVAAEIMAGQPEDPARKALDEMPWLERVELDPPVGRLAAIHLGNGEAEVIEWAMRHREFLAILDDQAARRAAQALGVKCAGTLRVLFEAANRGLLPSFADAVSSLKDAGLYCDENTINQICGGPGS